MKHVEVSDQPCRSPMGLGTSMSVSDASPIVIIFSLTQLNGIYLGIWVYADDIVLLSPSRAGLQFMTNMCEHYASEHNLKFSTNANIAKSKTKCMIFSDPIINTANICPIMLKGMPLATLCKRIKTPWQYFAIF